MARRLESGEIYSQPALTGAGLAENTQLATAVDALKASPNPVRLEDFALMHSVPDLLNPQSSLFARFKAHDRVLHDTKTDLWRYRPDFDLHNSGDLISLLQRHFLTSPVSSGLRISDLRGSFPTVREVVEELAAAEPHHDREVLVMRAGKDDTPRSVYWNCMRGESCKSVDDEFKTLWHSLRVPDSADLPRELHAAGLATASSTPVAPSGALRGNARGRGRGRRMGGTGRLLNTHIPGLDLSKEYNGPGAGGSSGS